MVINTSKGFLPILGANPSVLVLGTLPSVQSLRIHQYYGNPRNAFWPIIERLSGQEATLSYSERVQLAESLGVAVWDVYAAASRQGSLDSNIERSGARFNDFDRLLGQESRVKLVVCNGGAAHKAFIEEYGLDRLNANGIELVKLPSTSPAYAAMTFDSKYLAWEKALRRWLRF